MQVSGWFLLQYVNHKRVYLNQNNSQNEEVTWQFNLNILYEINKIY